VSDLALDRERGLEIDLAGMRAQVVDFRLRDQAGATGARSATRTARRK
jgi:hypothetical protein